MSESWKIDPTTKDYEQSGGSPVIDQSLRMPAYFRIMTPRLKWLYAPNTSFGSDFYTRKSKQTANEPSVNEAMAYRALRPILDDGRASLIEVEAIATGRQYNQLEARLTDAAGGDEPDSITLNPIGVGNG